MFGGVRGAGNALLDGIDRIRLERSRRNVERLERKVKRTRARVEEAFADLAVSMRGLGFDEDAIERHAASLQRLLDEAESAELGGGQELAL